MKKVVMAVLFIFALSSVAFASPLTDFSKGKAALDINYRVSPDYDVSNTSRNDGRALFRSECERNLPSIDGDSNLEWGFTYGIGNNWALQYRQATPKGSLTFNKFAHHNNYPSMAKGDGEADNPASRSIEYKTRVEEYNVMYQLDKNFTLFTGVVKATPSIKYNLRNSFNYQGDDKNIWQFGVVAVKPLNKDFTTYGIASVGSDYRNWEIGLGYKVAKDLEFNVNYRDMKVDGMNVATIFGHDRTTDTTVKGWGLGLTYNF